MTIYDYRGYREGKWWMVEIPAIDGLTQARHLTDVEDIAPSCISLDQDVPPSEVQLRRASVKVRGRDATSPRTPGRSPGFATARPSCTSRPPRCASSWWPSSSTAVYRSATSARWSTSRTSESSRSSNRAHPSRRRRSARLPLTPGPPRARRRTGDPLDPGRNPRSTPLPQYVQTRFKAARVGSPAVRQGTPQPLVGLRLGSFPPGRAGGPAPSAEATLDAVAPGEPGTVRRARRTLAAFVSDSGPSAAEL